MLVVSHRSQRAVRPENPLNPVFLLGSALMFVSPVGFVPHSV